MQIITVKIEKLVFGGQAMAFYEDKPVFVWNALPGEEVEVVITKKKKDYLEGIAINILKASPDRLEPKEDHFLSCSPWQILDWKAENEWKKKVVLETYKRIGKFGEDLEFDIFTDSIEYGYRNKMEYSLWEEEGKVKLAFHKRAARHVYQIDGCELAEPVINKVAGYLVNWINENHLPGISLKTLVLRSNKKGDVIAGIFIKDHLEFENFPELTKNLKGIQIYYSNPKSPASVPTDLVYSDGQDFLEEELGGVKYKSGLLSFFQVNVSVFEEALKDIKKNIEKDASVVDFYSGVGAIGLALAQSCKKVELVESNEEAVKFAKENIKLSGFKNVKASLKPSEEMVELIKSDKIVIFDPPRAGLHQKIIDKVLEVKPKKIIYMSCNISTQARDVGKLLGEYEITFLRLYNFFPRTPHVEGILVLERVKE